MDFLNTLYSNDNFGIILFITISILVLAFLIVLFFGKKDQKERKLAETKSLEINNTLSQNAFTDDQPTVQLNIDPEVFERPKAPVPEPIIETPNVSDNDFNPEPYQEESFQMEEPFENPIPAPEITPVIEEPVLPPKMDFDFDALADSISKELESISAPQKEEKQEEPSYEPKLETTPIFEPVKSTPIETPIVELESEPITPVIKEEEEKVPVFETVEKPKMPSPNQFSSVFVNKKKETMPADIYEPVKPVIEEPQEPVMSQITPAKPNFELPKTIDLPKLNTNNNSNTGMNNSNIVFSSLENDISSYQGNDENRM